MKQKQVANISRLIIALLVVIGSTLTPVFMPTYADAETAPYSVSNGEIAYLSYRPASTQIKITTLSDGHTEQILSFEATVPFVKVFPSGDKIAYLKCTSATHCDIFTANLDGSAESKITNIDGALNHLEISPAGDKIFFISSNRAYVINVDGSDLTSIVPELLVYGYSSFSPDGNKLALYTTSHGYNNSEIYTVGVDGSNPTRLTNNARNDFYPRWSPDGSKIAFDSNRASLTNYDIYVMDAGGGNVIRLTTDSQNDQFPDWTPDGSKIVFQSWRDGNREVYAMDTDGSNKTRLTHSIGVSHSVNISHDSTKVAHRICEGDENDAGYSCEIGMVDIDGTNAVNISNSPGTSESLPIFTPDDTAIVYTSISRYSSNEISAIDPSTGQVRQITDDPYNDRSPVWSPDGTKIAYISQDGGASTYSIFVIGAQGGVRQRVTSGVLVDINSGLSWSPDGSKLTFEGDTQDVFIVDIDGSNQTQLTTHTTGSIYAPQFSPDGTKIAYEYWGAGQDGIYVMDTSGSNLRRIAADRPNGYGPLRWSPDGKYILYDYYDNTNYMVQVEVVEVATDTVTALTTNPDKDHKCDTGFAWSPDSKHIAVCRHNDDWSAAALTIIDPQSGVAEALDLSGQGLVEFYSIMWSPDGQQILIYGYDNLGNYKTFLYTIATNHLEVVSGEPINIYEASWSKVIHTAPSLAINKVNGETYNEQTNRYTTSNLRPTFSGTATPGAEIKVEIHSDPIILTTTANSSGYWSVAPTFDLPSGEHVVYISASLAGLVTTINQFELVIGSELANTGVNLWVIVALAGTSMLSGGIIARRYVLRRRR